MRLWLILAYWVFLSCLAQRFILPAGPPYWLRLYSRVSDPDGGRIRGHPDIPRERLQFRRSCFRSASLSR